MKSLSLKVIIHIIFTFSKIFVFYYYLIVHVQPFIYNKFNNKLSHLHKEMITRHVKTYVTKNLKLSDTTFVIEGPISYNF